MSKLQFQSVCVIVNIHCKYANMYVHTKGFNGYNTTLYSGRFLGNGKQVQIWVDIMNIIGRKLATAFAQIANLMGFAAIAYFLAENKKTLPQAKRHKLSLLFTSLTSLKFITI